MSPPRAELTYRTSIRDANAAGDVHGGWILKLLDDAAVIAATRHCRTRVVTAAVDGVRFRQPVNTGEVLSFRATVNAVWRTSMEVGVRVESEDTITGTTRHVLTAYLTMVALDDEGVPVETPRLEVDGPEASRRCREAQLRRDIRLAAPPDLHQLHAALHAGRTDRSLVP
jgi:acyl-CoA hydrolase